MDKTMTSVGGLIRAGTQAAALVALLLAATPLAAQTVNEYRLPGTVTTQPTGSAPGPVDSDAPAVRVPPAQPDERPAATESSAASSAPVAVRPTPAPAATPRREAAPRPSPTGREVQPQPTPPASLPSPAPSTAPTTAPAALPSALPSAAPAPVPVTVPAEPASQEAPLWPWIAVIAALLAGGAGGWLLHRRKTQPLALAFEPPVVPRREPAAPPPVPEPQPAPAAAAPVRAPLPPEPAAQPAPPPAPEAQGLVITLEARRMSASLMATTLSYTLRLTNHGAVPLSALAVEGDMIAAHASLPPEQQIASDGQKLELRHAAVELAPGESAEFTGDFRLPLSAVTPIRAGDAAYFVPLARFRVEAGIPGGGSQVRVQTFVVGEVPENPAAALRPFRLDLGPRVYSRIGQRAVA